ncbi:MAG: hypothetical protein AB1631_05965 [Acidobacteriota bacterium]
MRTHRIKAMTAIIVIALYGLALPPAGDAHHLVRRVNLAEMTVLAEHVFVGRCLSVEETEEEIAGGILPITRYTFEVERAIKGRLPRQVTIRYLGHASPAKGGGRTMHGRPVSPKTFLHGMSPYREGDRLMLFLNADSVRGTTPVGLYQGAFFIKRMPSGQELAQNSINNLGLFTAPYTGFGLKSEDARVIFPENDQPIAMEKYHSLASRRGALPLDALIEIAEQVISAHGGERGVITGERGGLLK